jgi:ribosomal protein L11 methyltransferase
LDTADLNHDGLPDVIVGGDPPLGTLSVSREPVGWLEVSFEAANAETYERCVAALLGAPPGLQAGIAGVEEIEADPATGWIRARFYLPLAEDPFQARALAQAGGVVTGSRAIEDQAWESAWREGLTATLLGQRLAVVPSGSKTPTGRLAIHLDPGSAFGSGLHPTTRACADLMERAATSAQPPTQQETQRALEVGTGSGVLAIGLARLSPACSVLAIDNDPEAVDEAARNTSRNGVADRVETSPRAIESIDEQFPLVVANLDQPTLTAIGGLVAGRVALGGQLCVSGLREHERWPAPQGLKLLEAITLEGWRAERWIRSGA